MKCKFCGLENTHGTDEGQTGICEMCLYMIADAAIADGYTVAEGAVMKPCPHGHIGGSMNCCLGEMSDSAVYCDGSKRVKAGGGGT